MDAHLRLRSVVSVYSKTSKCFKYFIKDLQEQDAFTMHRAFILLFATAAQALIPLPLLMSNANEDRRLFFSFPRVPVRLGVKILNTPEIWAERVSKQMKFACPIVSDVVYLPKIHKDNTIVCSSQYGPISLSSLSKNHLVVTVYSYGKFDIVLNEYVLHQDSVGFSLLVTVTDCMFCTNHLKPAIESVFSSNDNLEDHDTDISSLVCIETWRSRIMSC